MKSPGANASSQAHHVKGKVGLMAETGLEHPSLTGSKTLISEEVRQESDIADAPSPPLGSDLNKIIKAWPIGA